MKELELLKRQTDKGSPTVCLLILTIIIHLPRANSTKDLPKSYR